MKNISLLGFAFLASCIEATDNINYGNPTPTPYRGRAPIYKKDPVVPNGMSYYWFRKDGSFISCRHDEIIDKNTFVFKCFALNKKNAIKKFNKFNQDKI